MEDGTAPSRAIAICDIHGCARALEALVEAIHPRRDDLWIILGDVVDRGPDVPRALDVLLELEQSTRFVFLLGNHEAMMLDALCRGTDPRFWIECGGGATLEAYGSLERVPESHVAFLNRHRLVCVLDEYFFVHANYEADRALEDLSPEVALWLHLTTSFPAPHYSGRIAVVGHTPQMDGVVLDAGHVIGLDTFCVGGGWLSALDVQSRRLWQADAQGRMRHPEGQRLAHCSKSEL